MAGKPKDKVNDAAERFLPPMTEREKRNGYRLPTERMERALRGPLPEPQIHENPDEFVLCVLRYMTWHPVYRTSVATLLEMFVASGQMTKRTRGVITTYSLKPPNVRIEQRDNPPK